MPEENKTKTAIVLLSGGLDSATCLAIAKEQGFNIKAISFDYGQRHSAELVAAKILAEAYEAAHSVFSIDMSQIGGSALTDTNIAVPDHDQHPEDEIPVTYVPARNTVFLSYALACAEVHQSNDIFIGVNAVDYSGYPDCRPEYIEAFQTMANLATKAAAEGQKIQLHTPLIKLTKAEIIQKGQALGLNYGLTVSCYQANQQGEACGRCDSCFLRRKGFEDAGLADPTHYHRETN